MTGPTVSGLYCVPAVTEPAYTDRGNWEPVRVSIVPTVSGQYCVPAVTDPSYTDRGNWEPV